MNKVIIMFCCLVFGLAGCGQSPSAENSNLGAVETPSPLQGREETDAESNDAEESDAEESSTAKSGDRDEPDFGKYKVDAVYSGDTAKLVFNKDTSEFKTRFQQAASGEVNFAGHYILATWGCGADCLMGGLIDAKTGNTSMLPFTVCCNLDEEDNLGDKMDFQKDSRLINFNGLLNENEEGGKVHFYELKDGVFKKLPKS